MPKKASYIRDIGGFPSYIGFLGNIGAVASLNISRYFAIYQDFGFCNISNCLSHKILDLTLLEGLVRK